jgi:hypothetical protein
MRPSQFLHLETELAAWMLDEACLVVGRQFQHEIDQGRDPFVNNSAPPGQRYRSISGGKKLRRVKIKPDGTW